jgi:hypothetical protein
MDTKSRSLRWIASGIFAAAVFAAASPAQARDGWGRHGFAPRARVSRFVGRAFPHVRYSRFYRPYFYGAPYYYAASPYYYDDDPYYYASSHYYYYGSPYYYPRPYFSVGVRSFGVRSFGVRRGFGRAFGPRVVVGRGHFRGR